MHRTALFSLLLAACLPKQPDVVKAPHAMDAAVAGVMATMSSTEVADLPEALSKRLDDALKVRNLSPKTVGAAEFGKTFSTGRTTQRRLAWLAENAQGAPLLVLVETEVEFYSQLSGRYRWTVQVKASVADASRPGEAVTSDFSVPVFLEYHHEKEPEALVAAAPVIERNLGFLLDEYLGGLQ